MTDNNIPKNKLEVMPQNREVDNFVQPDYRYGVDQEPLDSRKLKNKGFGDKKQI